MQFSNGTQVLIQSNGIDPHADGATGHVFNSVVVKGSRLNTARVYHVRYISVIDGTSRIGAFHPVYITAA